MKFFDIELIDKGVDTANFKFSKVAQEDLDKILETIKELNTASHLIFTAIEGSIVLDKSFFRGLMYVDHVELVKTTKQENLESAKEIQKLEKQGDK